MKDNEIKYFEHFSEDGLLLSLGTGNGDKLISKERYEKLQNLIKNKPQAPEGYQYMITRSFDYKLVADEVFPEAEEDLDAANID